MNVPDEVRRTLLGQPTVGTSDQAFLLITVDPVGFPHVCLLSRAELEADEFEIRAVLESRQTRDNLETSNVATLIAVTDNDAAFYCKLRVQRMRECEGRSAVGFNVVGAKRDSVGVELTAFSFFVDRQLPVLEGWEKSRRCLEWLTASRPGRNPGSRRSETGEGPAS